MGKGKKKVNNYSNYRKNSISQHQAAERAAKKKKDNIIKGCTAAGIVAVITAVIITVTSIVSATGFAMRSKVAMYCDQLEIDNAMLACMFYQSFNDYAAQYETESVDITKSLKKQYIAEDTSWYNYIMQVTIDGAKKTLTLAAAAKAAGMEPDSDDAAAIDSYIDALAQIAENKGISLEKYIEKKVCKGIKEQDIRNCLELSVLATKYREKMLSDISYTAEDFEAFKKNNEAALKYIDYKSYEFPYVIPVDATEEEKTAIKKDYQTKAEGLASCKSAEEFDAWLKNHLSSEQENQSEQIIQAQIDATLTTGYGYETNKPIGSWAFTVAKAAGESFIFEGPDRYTVYHLVKAPYFKNEATKTVRHILLTSGTYGSDNAALAQAQNVINMWLSGDATAQSFAKLASIYSEDPGSKAEGGLYTNISKGVMVSEFDQWCFDASRKAGDCGIIKTSFGYHIMFFQSEGLTDWQATAYDKLFSEDYNKAYTALEESHPIAVAPSFNVRAKK